LTTARVLDLRNDRLIVAGPLSFQYDVIARGGGLNVSWQLHEAYPRVSFYIGTQKPLSGTLKNSIGI
jgi:hypothetical protein